MRTLSFVSLLLLIVEVFYFQLLFSEPSGSFCGNSVVENDEQCDVGAEHPDKCCDQKCRLKDGAECR